MLESCLQSPQDHSASDLLIQHTATLHQDLKHKLEQGRDKLLELNSSGAGRVEALLDKILDAEQSPKLELFMTRLFDALGFLQEDHGESCYLLRPTESMISPLPGLDEEGMTVTYERSAATMLEHVHFFSWDHPMIQHAMDILTTDVTGKSSIAFCSNKSLPAGAYWLECLFVLSAKANSQSQILRFLPPTPLKISIDAKQQATDTQFIQLDTVAPKMGNQLINALKPQLEKSLIRAQQLAEQQAAKVIQERKQYTQEQLADELNRLVSLQKVNPAIRDEEIEHLAQQRQQLSELIETAGLQLEAVRVVVNNPQ